MLLTPHSAIGAAIAWKINPLLALPVAFITHFLADASIPHWNPAIYTEIKAKKTIGASNFFIILADFSLSLLLAAYFGTKALPDIKKALITFAGGISAILPDSFEIPFYFLGLRSKWLVKYVNFHHRIQIDTSFLPGMTIQLALIAFCWVLIS